MNLTQPTTATPDGNKMSKPWAGHINRWFERHWLLAFNGTWGVFVLLPWLAPLLMKLGLTGPARVIYTIYSVFCHQLPERSWFLFGPSLTYTPLQIAQAWGYSLADISHELVRRQFIGTSELGWKVAWSDRMVAMYTSIFLFGLLYAFLRQRCIRPKGLSWPLLLLLVAPLAVDGSTHLVNDVLRLDFRDNNVWAVILTNSLFPPTFYRGDLFGSLNSVLRVATGLLLGLGIVGFLWPLMEQEFSPDPSARTAP